MDDDVRREMRIYFMHELSDTSLSLPANEVWWEVGNFTEWDHPISRKRDHFGASVGSYAFGRLVSTVFFSFPR
jgi:hypothetical protein